MDKKDQFIELDEDIQEYIDFLKSEKGQALNEEYEKDGKVETA